MATETLRAKLARPVDRASLDVFRIAFGTLMCVGALRFFVHGWIDLFYKQPTFFFTYPGFSWVKPWPGLGMSLHYAAMAVAAACIALGVRYRLATVIFAFLFLYAELIDKTNYLNHYYYVTLVAFLLALMPLGRGGENTVPAWCLYLLRFQAGVVYFFAGVAKLNADWLLHAQPLRIWLAARSEWPIIGPYFELESVAFLASWAGAAFDLFVVPALLYRKTRKLAFVAVIVFHVFTYSLFDIGLFPWLMIVSATLFFSPSWPRRSLVVTMPSVARSPVPRWAVALMAVYCAVQVSVPLRRHFMNGETLWTEEGFRFAWNVMLVEKAGTATFEVLDPSTGKRWYVDPLETLTPLQARMMATQPDMIVQFAEHLGDEARRKGIAQPQVFVSSAVAFNGRTRRALFAKDENLLREGR